MNTTINLLDEYTINKIAAGEVVERPSSVVKELIENSIDAHSSKITVEIEDGGKKLIRITDNGTGIKPDEVEKAFLRHATSKILNVEDLYNLNSLGFRGEALASIASVSEVELITRTKENDFGIKICLSGGKIIKKESIGTSIGTTIIIRNLFFNTPARKKFLKSSNAETLSITDTVNKLSIGNPSIQFKYINNNKVMLTSPGDGNLKSAIRSIYGKQVFDNLIQVSSDMGFIKIDGFIGNTSIYRGNRSMQHVYVNGRYVKSTILLNSINDGYKSILPINKYGICFLNLYLNPDVIDVNIHPTKLEIKFENELQIYNVIKNTINDTLLGQTLIPKYEKTLTASYKENYIKVNDIINTSCTHLEKGVKPLTIVCEEQIMVSEDFAKNCEDKNTFSVDSSNIYASNKNTFIDAPIVNEDKIILPDISIVGTIFNTYIIGQHKDSIFLIDQHAAHERVLYETYLAELTNKSLTTQILIDPIILDFCIKDIIKIKDIFSIFEEFGFEIELFGNNSIIIRGVPYLFEAPESEKFILEILDNIDYVTNNYELKKDKIASMACKSAIKAKDKIHQIEIDVLIRKLSQCENPYTCPHGRPILVEMTKYEIEKMFKRII
ncbi:DNA mismatch repair endonuclease MutL [Alkalithermobacter paradoxus]|uniref:DNA mismatch repair protein MutL n=1 Tax=Alkalithermobacter paradoxus TaxID=29349 RepID=A0A1V4IBB6_9FIRM|nr:DNA mismatch repair protein MutL [[Clostridium] thermoalcaliphilum]